MAEDIFQRAEGENIERRYGPGIMGTGLLASNCWKNVVLSGFEMPIADCGDVLCVLGRGIEQVQTRFGRVWRPTRYLELLSAGRHSGERAAGISPNDDVSEIAGSHANVLAACQLYKEAEGTGAPRVLIFAAGRPDYLRSQSAGTLTEGEVLLDTFRRSLGAHLSAEVVILSENCNTKDDIFETAKETLARKLSSVSLVTVAVHVPRTEEFVKMARDLYPEIEMRVHAAEDALVRRYARFAACRKVRYDLESSSAVRRTRAREQRGIDALRRGSYRF